MTVAAVGTTTESSAATLTSSGIGQEDFLKILLTQLSFQDPLKPMDNQEFIAQMAQFTNLEQTKQLTDRVDTLLNIQSATQSIGLIGKTVEVSASSGTSVGTVTTITFSEGVPALTVKLSNGEFLTDVSPIQITVVR